MLKSELVFFRSLAPDIFASYDKNKSQKLASNYMPVMLEVTDIIIQLIADRKWFYIYADCDS
jgi:hypothetical protein